MNPQEEMELKIITVGMLDVNCYLLYLKKEKKFFIIDPGCECSRIQQMIKTMVTEDTTISYSILLTHAHVDHIGAVRALSEFLQATVYLPQADIPLYESPDNHLLPWVARAENLPKTETPTSNSLFQVILTPGHTQGSCCYLFSSFSLLFTGDTLFCQSVGRTDLPGGNSIQLQESLKSILELPENIVVYPGHGSKTTIKDEKKLNPYI